ncbi:hypothetical protein Pla52n_32150 [Stieleria varia]|uniref:Motility protein B-like N-terminal domain-containing protein n=2 Tax=Stieleria varia TaxID=2528005 RepID=A0A5C6ASW9_9BACT|nr:hypothetical protein Pla52n_32150 [Stieleria varia]
MTALLAFFIVLNSLAKEQTGANMYSGTGSFVKAFSNSGLPGGLPGNRSRNMIQQEQQKPIYALSENLEKNLDKTGPDDTDKKDQIKDRDKENFQKFLTDIEKQFGLKNRPELINQIVFDSFEPNDRGTGGLSKHAIELLSEAITKLRRSNSNIEIILWANMPSPASLANRLDQSVSIRREVEQMFWLTAGEKSRIRYRVKPWLFADAKRPIVSIIFSRLGDTPLALVP